MTLQNGSLAVPGGRDIAPIINALLDWPFVLKIATKDWHPRDHVSFASNHPGPNNQPFISSIIIKNPFNESEAFGCRLWPVHCVQGSSGAQLIPELNLNKLDHVIEKGQDSRVEMYSAFTDPFEKPSVSTSALPDILKEAKISHVYVVGLAMDYCVKHSALDSTKYGFRTYVIRDGTRAVESGHDGWYAAEQELRAAGVTMVGLTDNEMSGVKQRH